MASRQLNNSLAVATILVAAVWLYAFFSPRVPTIDRRPQEAVGERLALEAVRLLGAGSRMIVVTRESKPFPIEANEVQMAAFLAALKKAGHSAAVTHRLRLDPLRPAVLSVADFLAVMKNAQENDVIVSFLGLPPLSDEQAAALGIKPRVVALCPRGSIDAFDLKRIFRQKIFAGAAVLRLNAAANFAGASKEEAFNHLFAWISPANLSELDDITVHR